MILGTGCNVTLLAAFSAPPPGSEWPFALNVFAWLAVLLVVASLALTLKKLFGRAPSLDTILAGLVSVTVMATYKAEQVLLIAELTKQLDEADREFQLVRDIVSRLQERTETHIRKLDQYDGKLERLLIALGKRA